jgi:hypothetical protein
MSDETTRTELAVELKAQEEMFNLAAPLYPP